MRRYGEAHLSWYCVHIVMRMRFRDGRPGMLYVQENVVLFEAQSFEDARRLGEARGRADSNEDDPTFTCDGRPAFWECAGVRIVVSCEDERSRPVSGTELTYMEYRLSSDGDLHRLLAGEDVPAEFGAGP